MITKALKESLVEIKSYSGIGYRPLIDFESWRVAYLKYHTELLPENINSMQRHDETDEVFVLLEGECILFIADGEEEITDIYAINMEPLKLYNVKKKCWHSHTLSEDASVLIVENKDTTLENSPMKELNEVQHEKIITLTKEIRMESINDKK